MQILGKLILIKPDDNPKEIKGILVPGTAKRMANTGTVLSCGPSCETVKEGDRVIYSAKNGSILPIKGVEHHSIMEEKILYVYGKDEGK